MERVRFMRFSNILLVHDARRPGQAVALRCAAALARTEGAKLTISEVVDSIVTEVPRYSTNGTVRLSTDAVRASKIRRMKELAASNGAGDLDFSVTLLVGKPHLEITRAVRENRHDLVVKAFAGRHALRFFSGVQEDRELIRSCPCPVWLVNVAEQDNNKCILVALDMPAEGGLDSGLNQRIVEVSTSMALAESRSLHFFHAWHLPGVGHIRAQCNPAADLEADRILAREAANRKTWLQDTVAMLRSGTRQSATEKIKPEVHVVNGDAKKVIPDLAEKLGVGLIVMGAAARTGLSGFARRNTVETILSRSDFSLLVVRQPEPMPACALRATGMVQIS